MRKPAFLFLCSLFIAGCTPLKDFQIPHQNSAEKSKIPTSAINDLFQSFLDQGINDCGLIGAQISITLPDGVTWSGSSGTTDLERTTPMTPEHIIRLGSLTKTYTAVLIFHLIEKGYLSLDNTIDRWFPEYRFSRHITINMLLHHSSGIPDLLGMRVMIISSMKSRKMWTTDELLKIMFEDDLDFSPGTDHQYSNSNYVLLGMIAERITGKAQGTLFREEIFEPLGLKHTFFLPADTEPAGLIAGYDRSLIPLPGWHKIDAENTAWSSCALASGAIAASASDVAVFLSAIMNYTIISEQSYEQMTQFARAKAPDKKYLTDFGSGLFRYGEFYRGAVGHLGLFIGSESVGLYWPQKKMVLVFLTNTSRARKSDDLITKYLNILFDDNASADRSF